MLPTLITFSSASLMRRETFADLSRLWLLFFASILLILTCASSANATVISIEPITWNVVGLDSNSPLSGPNRFPVGARVCTDTGGQTVTANFFWDSTTLPALPPKPLYLNITNGISSVDLTTSAAPPYCADAYFEIAVTRDNAAFETSRQYHISAGALSTPTPRELYVKPLVSQARNGILDLKFGESLDSLTSVAAGGSFSLVKGKTYFIRMSSYTAPGGYEQLETFSTLPNTIFQVLSVVTTYTADTTTNVSSPNDKLYGDACYWEEDPESPDYLSCLGDGKIGGTMDVTYEVKIVDIGAGINPINSLIYDLSGASYHYNTDYDSGGRTIYLVDPAAVTIAKRFSPATILPDGKSTLIFTLTNPNGGGVSEISFTDLFPTSPGAMTVANPPNLVTSCGGSITNSNNGLLASGDVGIKLSGGNIDGFGSCIISLDVTATSEGDYHNQSDNIFVGTVDTGDNADAWLSVNSTFFQPPNPPSACVVRTEMARWNFDADRNGIAIPSGNNVAPDYGLKHASVASAAASINLPARLTVSTISTVQKVSGTNSWAAGGTAGNNTTGWRNSGGGAVPAEAPPDPNSASYQFNVDSRKFGDVKISFSGRRTNDWTGTNNYVRIHENTNGATWASTEIAGLASNAWAAYNRTTATHGAETIFRINAYYRANNKSEAQMYIDDVVIDGCFLPDPPTIAKGFTPATISAGRPSSLTFTIKNANPGEPLTGVEFSDVFPANLVVSSGMDYSATTSGCSHTTTPILTSVAGSGTVSLANASIAGGGTCTVSVNVTSPVADLYKNVSGYINSTNGGRNTTAPVYDGSGNLLTPGGYAEATLTVLAPPTIEKSFSPATIYTSAYSGVSTLTFTIVNPNPDHVISGVAFSDDFPGSAPNDIVVASPTNATISGCSATSTPTYAPVSGSGSVSFSNASIAAGGTCTVTVDVQSANPGFFENTAGPVTYSLDNTGGDTASDALLVTVPNPQLALLKQVGTSAGGPWVTAPSRLVAGSASKIYYRFTVENIGDQTLSNIQVSDPDISDLASCTWVNGDGTTLAAPFILKKAGANDVPLSNLYYNDHYASCVIGPYPAGSIATYQPATFDYRNTATATGIFTDPNPDVVVSDTSSAIYLISNLALSKSVSETFFIESGDTLNYSYLVTNNGPAELVAPLVVFDNKIPSASISCPAGNLAAGASTTCTATYTITDGDVINSSVTNTARARIGGIYSPNDRVSVTILPADLAADKRNDTSGNEIMAGGSFIWTLTVRNNISAGNARFAAGDILLLDNLPNSSVIYGESLPVADPAVYPLAIPVARSAITGAISCTISSDKNLTCTAGAGGVTIPSHLRGTVAAISGSPTLIGTATLFTSQLTIGSILLIEGTPYTVSAIGSDTSLTLSRNYNGATMSGLQIPASFSALVAVRTELSGLLTYPLSLANPRSSGNCMADPDVRITESSVANNSCSNTVIVKVLPDITVVKTVSPYWDPINESTDPRAIPGAFMTYTLEIKNSGFGSVDNNTTILTDKVPDNSEFFVGDFGGAGSGPISFNDSCVADTSPSGLSYTFAGIDDTLDNLQFSKTNGTTFDAVAAPADLPVVADANQCDPQITHFRLSLTGPFKGTLFSADNKATSFCLQYRVRLK